MYSEGEILEVEYHRLSRKLDEIVEKLKHSSQPDRAIFSIIRSMRTPRGLRPIEVNLENSPDIFPCLAALSVLVSVESGWSRFSGAPHLRHKESDRIHGIVRLLSLLGHEYVEHPDGLEVKALGKKGLERVWGRWRKLAKQGLLQSYDPDQDHRLAFAAAVLAAFGAPICVRGRGVVAKSIPSFWSIIEGEAPRVALIGHRGVGKTSAATRWTNLLGASVKVIDLDFEIERFLGAPLSRYFEERGESEFRKVEHEVWRRIDVETRSSLETIVVAVGAGFDVSRIDDSWTRLWLRRATDGDGRFFSDRPRLNPELAPIEEWRKRYISRESQYEASADRILDLSEGGSGDLTEAPDLAERAWISDFFQTDHVSAEPIHFLGGAITLPRDVNVKETCERLLRWGISRIELRDDIWPPRTQVEAWAYFRTLPSNRLVISFRDKAETEATLKEVEKCMAIRASDTNGSPAEAPLLIDWPFDQVLNSKATDQNGLLAALPGELVERLAAGDVGLVASFHGSVIGLNQNPESLTRTLEACEQRLREVIKPTALVMKLALTLDEENPWAWVRHFDAWLRRDLEGRIFLPIAPMKQAASYGRWNWYRAWYGAFAPFGLSFWREGHGSSVDQPTFSQWWRRGRFARGSTSGKTLVETFDRARKTGFAAVLGQPVHHSRTPLEHDAFFSKLGMPVFAISVARGEMAEALPFLQEIGLRAAAVTAPSKEEVMQGAAVRSVNTIWWQAGAWSAANTDGVGLQALLMEAGVSDREKVAVWGGGGVLAMVRERLPLAQFFGASSGRLRENDAIKAIDVESPSVVLWASGAERGAWPETWKPALIVDLSYTENSMARVVALETGARYVSGIRMFKAQAEAQRVFWTECGRRQERSDQTPKERT
jgi:shikimate kinase